MSEFITMQFLPFIAAFIAGFAAGSINYKITGAAIKRGGSAALYVMPLRVMIAVALLAACYFIGKSANVLWPLLIGVVSGMTVALALFTAKLLRNKTGSDNSDRKGDN